MRVKCTAAPALYKPAGDGLLKGWLKSEVGGQPVGEAGVVGVVSNICNALSLVKNHHISWKTCWYDFKGLEAFDTATTTAETSNAPANWAPEQQIEQEDLTRAWNLLKKAGTGRLIIRESTEAISRWAAAKNPGRSLSDRFIDLRVAIEGLYGPKDNRELTFRAATNGAWHLGGNREERREYHRTLIAAYRKASRAVHTGKAKDGDGELLEDALNLCQRGMMKMLTEGVPDFDEITFG